MKEHVSPAARLAANARVVVGLGCLLTAFAAGPAAAARASSAAAGGSVSGYAVRHSCPARPHGARCLATRLVPVSGATARSASTVGGPAGGPAAETRAECESTHKKPVVEGCDGLTPQDLWSAYGLTTTTAGTAQTIAIVAAFDDPNLEKDLKKYSKTFELTPCTKHQSCLTKVNQNGAAEPLPPANPGWAEEISIDVEMAHAVCQNCHIVVVEASSEGSSDLEAAEEAAAKLKPEEISNSWVEPEPATEARAFHQPGIVITAGSGDEGLLNWVPGSPEAGQIDYPASSPDVVSVGGTRLEDVAGTWTSSVWNGEGVGGERGATGGGCSEHFEAPYWQLELPDWSQAGCSGKRAVADISAVADPYTGVAIYDTTPDEGGQPPYWERLGGTSVSAPIIAAMFALAGGAGPGVEYPARTLYENAALKPGAVTDVVGGSNGACKKGGLEPGGLPRCSAAELGESCEGEAICVAGPGYDGPSGLGTPDGLGLFEPTGAPPKRSQEIELLSQAPSPAHLSGPGYEVAVRSTSGLGVTLVSATTPVCQVEGSTVTFSAVGTCTIEALQAGDHEFGPAASVRQSFAVEPGLQTITFLTTPPASPVAGGPAYDVNATASSGLPVTLTSSTPAVCTLGGSAVSFIAPGTCTVEARQEGNDDWEPAAAVRQSMTVGSPLQPGSSLQATGGASLGALSFSSGTAGPNSSFSVAAVKVDHRSGAITFTLTLSEPGSVAWRLTFGPRASASARALRGGCRKGAIRLAGSCHATPAVFASGHLQATRAGKVTFTVNPGRLAGLALAATAGSGRGILVRAELTVQSAKGGRPASLTHPVPDYRTAAGRR